MAPTSMEINNSFFIFFVVLMIHVAKIQRILVQN